MPCSAESCGIVNIVCTTTNSAEITRRSGDTNVWVWTFQAGVSVVSQLIAGLADRRSRPQRDGEYTMGDTEASQADSHQRPLPHGAHGVATMHKEPLTNPGTGEGLHELALKDEESEQ